MILTGDDELVVLVPLELVRHVITQPTHLLVRGRKNIHRCVNCGKNNNTVVEKNVEDTRSPYKGD